MLGNFQGQPLTPINRAIDRSAPGFAVLLNSIQGVANRVVENKRLAEEREFVRKRDTDLHNKALDKITFAADIEGRQREGLARIQGEEQRATQLNKAQLDRAKSIFDLQLQSSPEYLEQVAAENEAQAYGRASGEQPFKIEDRAVTGVNNLNNTILNLVKDFPGLAKGGYRAVSTENGEVVIEGINPFTGEMSRMQPGVLTMLVGQEAQLKNKADNLIATYDTADYDEQTRQSARQLATRLRTGDYGNIGTINQEYDTFVGLLQTTDRSKQQETNVQVNNATQLVAQTLTLRDSQLAPEWLTEANNKVRKQGKNIFTRDELVSTEISNVLRQGGPDLADRLEGVIRSQYASLAELSTALDGSRYVTEGESKYNAGASQFANAITGIILPAGQSGRSVGEPLYINPFAPSGRQAVGSARELTNAIIAEYSKNKTSTTDNTTRDYLQNTTNVVRGFFQ